MTSGEVISFLFRYLLQCRDCDKTFMFVEELEVFGHLGYRRNGEVFVQLCTTVGFADLDAPRACKLLETSSQLVRKSAPLYVAESARPHLALPDAFEGVGRLAYVIEPPILFESD